MISDWNQAIVEEFRANEGRVDSQFKGANMMLMHHVGRKSGEEHVAPIVFFTDDASPGAMFVVGSAAGAPKHPQWYFNMTAAGHATVEVGTETFDVDVEDLPRAERDRVFADIKQQAPGFGDYETKIAGARVMPVLALRRRG